MADRRWDAVVVGGGTAGCVVAARLVESGRRVALVEAGPGEPRPASVAGLDAVAAADEPTRQWPQASIRTDPGSARFRYRQGLGLGGSSMINSMLLCAGDRADYRRWEQQHGCGGWGPQDMDPWLAIAAERFPGGTVAPGLISGTLERAAVAAGHPVGGSSMDQDRLGMVEARLAIDRDRRRSAVDAYLWPHLDQATGPRSGHRLLTLVTGRSVRRILVSGATASGIELSDGERFRSPLVVVCAGAIGTPALLLTSGLNARPVGRRLKDHPSFAFTLMLRTPGPASFDEPVAAESRAISRLLRWSSGPTEHGDLQAFVIDRVDHRALPESTAAPARRQPVAVVVVGLMRVSTTGRVALGTGRDGGWPEVTTGGGERTDDRLRLGAAVRHIHQLLEAGSFRPVVEGIFLDDRGTPADALRSMDDDELHRWLATHPGPYAHPAASCPMGPDGADHTVVSCEPEQAGRLLGYDGLFLADASIMPDLVQGGLQVPVVALAERVVGSIISRG